MTEERYTVIATGGTYRVKEDLKHWGFRWHERGWVKGDATQGEVNLFKHWANGAEWDGVNLEIEAKTTSYAKIEGFEV